MGLLVDALVNVKYSLTRRAALYYSRILSSKEAGTEVACSFHCTYVCMCARLFLFSGFITAEMIYLGETIFIRYLILAKV